MAPAGGAYCRTGDTAPPDFDSHSRDALPRSFILQVEEAVLDAEAEEREELAERQQAGAAGSVPHVPSVIWPANYGGDQHGAPTSPPSSSPNRAWKRFMYPAGGY